MRSTSKNSTRMIARYVLLILLFIVLGAIHAYEGNYYRAFDHAIFIVLILSLYGEESTSNKLRGLVHALEQQIKTLRREE